MRDRPPRLRWQQFFNSFHAQCAQLTTSSKDITGAARALIGSATAFSAIAAAGLTTNGLVIGSGETPFSMLDYKLQTQVTANITHSAVQIVNESFGLNGWRVNIIRSFTNATGATLEIKEVGWYGIHSVYNFLFERTLYSLSVLNTKIVTLTLRLSAGA